MGQFSPGGPDQAVQVLSGQFSAVGTSAPIAVYGMMNVVLWGSSTTSLTVTNGSSNATIVSGTGLLVGDTVYSPLGYVPPGTTLASGAGTSWTLAFPTIVLPALLNGTTTISGLSRTAGLGGATVTGPTTGIIPANTTVSSITTPAVNGAGGVAVLSNAALIGGPSGPVPQPTNLNFALTNNSVVSGTDTNAVFENVSVSATVNLERSFDGGDTWVTAWIGEAGQQASFNLGTTGSVSIRPFEPERGVYYRLNCVAYSSGTIDYRLSITGSVPSSWAGIAGT